MGWRIHERVRPDRWRELEGAAIVTIVAQERDKSLRRIRCGVDEAICFDTSVVIGAGPWAHCEGRTIASEEGADGGTKHVY